jgi:hypothetical protein
MQGHQPLDELIVVGHRGAHLLGRFFRESNAAFYIGE